MSEPETLSDLAIRAVSAVNSATKATSNYNDFGEFTGFQDESMLIREELRNALHSACLKSSRLQRRIKLFEEGKHHVTLLRPKSET